ncbi:MAG: hypothetical protein WCR52_07070 [Bacteroidota bacterium]
MRIKIAHLLFVYAAISGFTIFYFDGTGDAGDSVFHYLYAKYAPLHPDLYFDHWAKPVFVLLSSPFAQFGFMGMKVFNALVSLGTIYMTWRTADQLYGRPTLPAALMLMCAPLFFILTFSGLTEPLFALFVISGVHLAARKQFLSAGLLISFLPFVRSEGLLFMGVFGLYFLFLKQLRYLPTLLVGHLAYSIAGYFVFHDLLWVFNKIPYARMGSIYGKGDFTHFIPQLFYAVGFTVYGLFIIGLMTTCWKLLKGRLNPERSMLVLGGFSCFFAFHSLAWHLGIFNSMGLTRVFVGVMPLMALLALDGYQSLGALVENRGKLNVVVPALLTALIVVLQFTGSPSAVHLKDLRLNKDQLTANRVADFIRHSEYGGRRVAHAHPYLSMALGIDHFDSAQFMDLKPDVFEQLKFGEVVIWDSWFAVVEQNITLEMLEKRVDLQKVFEASEPDRDRKVQYVVFVKH